MDVFRICLLITHVAGQSELLLQLFIVAKTADFLIIQSKRDSYITIFISRFKRPNVTDNIMK